MHAADLPDNESQRLAALHGLHVLDTADDEGFARLTQLACELFDVPTSLVSLVDRDRQWFKAVDGIELQNLPREQTVCQVTVARAYDHPDDPALIIPDVSKVPAFAAIPTLAITSLEDSAVRARGHLPQTVEILHKPVLPAVLQERVRFHLSHAGGVNPPA